MNEPKWGPIGSEVYERTYQRVKSNGEKETWEDTVRRVVAGNTGLVDERYIEANEREKLFDLIYNFKAVPAGRHLWVSGVPGRQFLFNCHRAAFTENLADHYTFTFDELMKGGGVGANYSSRYTDAIPGISNRVDVHIVCEETHPDYDKLKTANVLSKDYSAHWDGCVRIADSREGWVDALNEVIWAFYASDDGGTLTVVLDVSIVREEGARIRGFGGTASGPLALAQMLQNVARVINGTEGRVLNPLEHMEIDHEIACCVVAGNVRRSARMSILSWLDPFIFDFITCKSDISKHWTTNISVEIDDLFFLALKKKNHELHDHAVAVYKAVIAGMLENGEPGFYNISLASVGELGDVGSTNPCGEIALEQWENCNLGHVDISQFSDDFEGAKEAFRLMTRFLIRATFGDVPNPLQREVVDRNRRIGVGFFGYHGWLVKQGIRFSESHSNRYVRKTMRDFKAVIDKEKARYAFQLRIPVPIKGTTLAPTGSISQLNGSTPSAQTIYAPYFIRRVRYSSTSPELERLAEEGNYIEDDHYSVNTKVVSFVCRDPLLDLTDDESLVEGANDVGLEDFLAVQAMLQETYADNAISFTVNVEPDAQQRQHFNDQIAAGVHPLEAKFGPASQETLENAEKIIIHYLPNLKGTTIMVDGTRPQSPYERISKAEYELAEYVKTAGSGELACGPNGCPVK